MIELPDGAQAVFDRLGLLPIVVGAAMCAAGWLLYWCSLQFIGAVLLGAGGLLAGDALAQLFDLAGVERGLVAYGLAFLGVLLGMGMARLVHRLAIFLLGWALGAAFFFWLVAPIRGDTAWDWMSSDAFLAFGTPIFGLLTGLLAIALERYIVILATSLLGAALVAHGMEWPPTDWRFPALMVAGIVIQTIVSRPWKKRPRRDDPDED